MDTDTDLIDILWIFFHFYNLKCELHTVDYSHKSNKKSSFCLIFFKKYDKTGIK